MLNHCYSQLDDERKKQASFVQTLTIFEQDLATTKKKLLAEEQARKSADLALEGYQKQAEDQGKSLREANAELKAAREQVVVLKKHLEETQKLREQAEKSKEEVERGWAERLRNLCGWDGVDTKDRGANGVSYLLRPNLGWSP